MGKNTNFVSHKKSKQIVDGKPKLPEASALVEGEIAINFGKDVETLSIKNESGDVVTFSSDNYYTEKKLGSGFTGENSANTVTSVIESNEKVTALALADLDERKLENSDLSNYYKKKEIDNLVGSGFSYSSITEVITENEEIVSSALNDLDERKLDASAYTPTMEIWVSGSGVNSAVLKGGNNTASGTSSVAEGSGSKAIGDYSHAEGHATATGDTSHAEGAGTALGSYSHAEGHATATGDTSHAEGYGVALGSTSHAEGQNAIASGSSSHAEGSSTQANGDYSHAEGVGTKANGQYSHAEGDNTIASGSSSHAEGYYTTANSQYSHAEGQSTIARGVSSHAEGAGSNAIGDYSHAEGHATASGDTSHAEGYGRANGSYSHAEGNSTTANGQYSHAEGYQTTANGFSSHAEGVGTQANGYYSHAEGAGTQTNNMYEHASGQYNVSNSATTTFGDSGNTLFSVGNGINGTPHNAFEIRQNGNIYITSGGTDILLQDNLGGNIEIVQVIDSGTSASTNAVATKAVVDKLIEDEQVWAISFNQLNSKKFGYVNFDSTNRTIDFYKDEDDYTSGGTEIGSVDLSDISIDIDQVIDSGTSASTHAVATKAVYEYVTSYTPSITVDQDFSNTASTNPISTKAVYSAITDNELVWTNAYVAMSGTVSAHTANTEIHVTAADKEKLHTHSNKTSLDSITGNVGTMAYEDKASYSSATEVNTALDSKVNTSDVVSAITPSNSGSTDPIATKVVAENEKIVSNALNDLNARLSVLEAALGGMALRKVTQAEYDALTVKDPNTLFIIND